MKSFKPSYIWLPVSVAIFFVLGILVGEVLTKSNGPSSANKKFATIMNLIENEYVDSVDLDSLLEQTLPNLLSNLDPHSYYIPKSKLKGVNDELEGSFSGVGIQFTVANDTATVIEVVVGGPSEKVGLQAGDRIVSVDGESIAGIGINAEGVREKLKGETGTNVRLGIKRQNSPKLLTFDVTRGPVPVYSVTASYMANDSTGYIRVDRFVRTTYQEFVQALIMLAADGARNYIIDLRGNQGGFMEVAILMVNEFLEKNSVIVAKKGRDGRNDEIFFADGNGAFKNAGLVVLIDENSASSSEIFAGAVQDNDRGLLIGRRSFGKGLIQRQADLPDSSAVRLTIARYYTPSGRCIQRDYSDAIGYRNDIYERYNHGELFTEDSVKLNLDDKYTTAHGRTVYGGGGIMPDIYVPVDTSKITNYYIVVANEGLLQRFAFEYCDQNRQALNDAANILDVLPPDDVLLRKFVNFASSNGIPARWYYINISRDLIVNQLKAFIARDIEGMNSYSSILQQQDSNIQRALNEIAAGNVAFPILPKEKIKNEETENKLATDTVK